MHVSLTMNRIHFFFFFGHVFYLILFTALILPFSLTPVTLTAFSWEDVKGDKYRENYLGHSVKASVGRWQKGKAMFLVSVGSLCMNST